MRKSEENKEEPVSSPFVLPPPPDGGWGWVICFACFMCNFIAIGIEYCFGVILPPLVEYFDSNRRSISLVGSLLSGVAFMSGPIVGGLVNKFGCRFVCILGSLVACLGIGLSTLSPNVPILMVTYGLIGGFGLGLIYLPATVAVGYYFESKRALATGISVCGSGVGTFVFAPLATQLLSVYDWKSVNLVFAGFCLCCVAFGALMRPLELKAKIIDPENEEETLGEANLQSSTPNVKVVPKPDDKYESNILPPIPEDSTGSANGTITNSRRSSVWNRAISSLESRFQMSSDKMENNPMPQNVVAKSIIPLSTSMLMSHVVFAIEDGSNSKLSNDQLYLSPSSSRRDSRRMSKILVRPFSRNDILYSGSISRQVETNDLTSNIDDQKEPSSRRLSITRKNSIIPSNLSIAASERKLSTVIPNELLDSEDTTPMWDTLKEMIHFPLLSNPIFMLLGLSNMFVRLGLYVPLVYMPNVAVLSGVAVKEANFLISIFGISNTIGRVLSGWFCDFAWVDSLFVTNIAILLCGISTLVIPFCTSYVAFTIVAITFGFFAATISSLTSIVLVDLLGLENLTSAFGLLSLFRGVTTFMGPPLAGAIFDATENYDISFYVAGGSFVLASLISFGAQLMHRTIRKSDLKTGNVQ